MRCDREFLLLVFISESAHVPHNLKRVCIDGVDMKQVELHLPDDSSKFREIGTQDPIVCHSTKLSKQVLSGSQ